MKLLENEKFSKKFYKYISCGNLKKLNALLDCQEGEFDKEYLDNFFLQSYLTSNNFDSEILKRILDEPSLYIDVKFSEDVIFQSLYKMDKDTFYYIFTKGKMKITEPLLQRIFEDDRLFFLEMVKVDGNLGKGILNELINKNDAFAHEVIDYIKGVDRDHFENAIKKGVAPSILEHLLKKDEGNTNFDNHRSGLMLKALKNIEENIYQGGGNIREGIIKLKIICDYAQVSDREYQAFLNELNFLSTKPFCKSLFPLIKASGACDKLLEGYLNGKLTEPKNFNIMSLASANFKPSKRTMVSVFERGDFSKVYLIKDKLNINLKEYKKELDEGIKGLILRLSNLGDEQITRLAEQFIKFAKEEKILDLDGEELVGILDKVEKSRDNWKLGFKKFKLCLYLISDNYGMFSGKVVGDALASGERWYCLLNKNIDLSKSKMSDIVWGITENNGRYGFNKKLLDKIFNLKGFNLNEKDANFLLFEGAINIYDENKKNNLLEQKKYFNYLIENKKIIKIQGINWGLLLKQKGVKQNDEIYQKILRLAEGKYQEIEEE